VSDSVLSPFSCVGLERDVDRRHRALLFGSFLAKANVGAAAMPAISARRLMPLISNFPVIGISFAEPL
jgi:hypothetical protein